jgi:hypothetical protein
VALNSNQVKSLQPGVHADGGRLYLVVRESGDRVWAFRFTDVDGKRAQMEFARVGERDSAAADVLTLSSSPRMRGAPQSGFSTHICEIKRAAPHRSAVALPWARLPTPEAAKAGSVPTHERLGPHDFESLQDGWKPAIQLDKEPAIMVREPDATLQLAPQDNQLMSKHRVLSFKPCLRPERRARTAKAKQSNPIIPPA